MFGEEHERTAESYRHLGATQYAMHEYTSALESHQFALAIRFLKCLEKNMKELQTATPILEQHNTQCITTPQRSSPVSVDWLSLLKCF